MARRIRILPDHLANQIAAGEVVERPASVVKELMENALDAGAHRVDVVVRDGGKSEIRVADDGHGMGREDALLALDRHATSKIATPEDLATVRTLGFRGEALPSIASVSRMVLETAEREGEGTRLLVKGGKLTGIESCSRTVGTTIAVRSLFFNTPARAKFVRSTPAETRAIVETVTVLSLAHPEVGVTLESNGRGLLDLPPVVRLEARIAGIWGSAEADDLIPVAHEGRHASVQGLIERPHAASAGGRRAYLYVNGRAFADRGLVRAVDRGYHTTIPPGVRPSFFLYIEVPPEEVDVNVHPAKAEVRFRNAAAVQAAIEEAVRAALEPIASVPAIGVRSGAEGGAAVAPRLRTPANPGHAPADSGTWERTPSEPVSADQISLFVSGQSVPQTPGAQPGGGVVESESTGAARQAMWQVHNTYIFAETRDGLIVVDQHAAHERILYEELMRGWEGPEEDAAQRLLFPLTIRLTPAELDTVEQLRSLFTRIGYELEEFGGRSIIVHSVPNPHLYFDAERCLRDMIRELTEGSDLVDAARNQHQRIALSFACKAAVKAGQRLSEREIAELFDRLFATELPFHDVHGRPTAVQLSLAELHSRFRRSG